MTNAGETVSEDIDMLLGLSEVETETLASEAEMLEFLDEHNVYQIYRGIIERYRFKGPPHIDGGLASPEGLPPTQSPYLMHAYLLGETAFVGSQRHSGSGLTSFNYSLAVHPSSRPTANLTRGSGIHRTHAEIEKVHPLSDEVTNGELVPVLVKESAFDLASAVNQQNQVTE